MMDTNYKAFLSLIVVGLLLVFSFNNCSEVRLGQIVSSSQVPQPNAGEFCLAEPEVTARYTKFLFVVDKSGSNVQNPGGTDPTNAKRAANIERFFNEKKNSEYIHWGYIAFGREQASAEAYINEGGDRNKPVFMPGNSGAMENAIDLQKRERDNGCTPYLNALSLAKLAVRTDIERNPTQDSTYMVFFMSDGGPTDSSGGSGCQTAQPAGQIHFDSVKELVDIKPGRVYLSSAFYGPNPTYAEGVRKMAEVGRGKFINLESGSQIDFNDLIVEGPNSEPWTIKQFLVYNVNTAICENGSYDSDSDADGLCDRDEAAYDGMRDGSGNIYRFSPTNRWSNAGVYSGFSDYFAWRALKYGERPTGCSDPNPRKDDDFDMLSTCEENYINNPNPMLPPSWGVRTSLDPVNSDTDGDGYLDGLEAFVFRMNRGTSALDMMNVFRNFDPDPENAGQQIVKHRNPEIPDTGARAYDTYLRFTGINSKKQACYQFRLNTLWLYPTQAVPTSNVLEKTVHGTNENVVMLYYMMTPQSDTNGKGALRYSFQKLYNSPGYISAHGESVGLKLNKFETYKIPDVD